VFGLRKKVHRHPVWRRRAVANHKDLGRPGDHVDAEALLPLLHNAGAIFLGRWSSEAIGDYCAGPNHVLPTAGTARFSSPLGVYDFQKRSSVIGVSEAGARTLGRVAATLAEGEGLQAHAAAAAMRFK
jgi:histidinol dehydrogenase